MALHVQLHNVLARVVEDLVVVDVDVLLRARDRDAALQTMVLHEAVAGDRRVAVEAIDTELEATVPLEECVVDVDAVVVQLLVRQVDERQLERKAAVVVAKHVVRHLDRRRIKISVTAPCSTRPPYPTITNVI